MPSHPPETDLYDNPRNYDWWRDISRLYEDSVGSEGEFKEDFKAVLRDVLNKLESKP